MKPILQLCQAMRFVSRPCEKESPGQDTKASAKRTMHGRITAGWQAWWVKLAGTLALVSAFSSASAQLFSVDITVNNMETGTLTFVFDDVESVIEQIDEDELEKAFSSYTHNSAAKAVVDWRGVPVELEFESGKTTLILDVPSIGIRKEFIATSRDASADALLDFLKGEGDELLNALQKKLIEESPVDPIAGNPSSLATSQISSQFESGFTDQVTNISKAPDASASTDAPDNHVVFGAQFAQFEANGKRSNAITLPLGYQFNFQSGGRGIRSLDFSLPLTYIKVEDAEVIQGFLNVGLTYGVNDRWSLSPAVGAGVVGSVDLGSAGGISTVSLTSTYTIPREKYALSIGNMIGYSETLDIEIGDYSFDPDVSNTVLRNGAMVSIPNTMWGRDVATELWITDTRFFGDKLYSEYYDEFGISFGLAKTKDDNQLSIENYLRAGVSYLTGDGVTGWRANLGYSF